MLNQQLYFPPRRHHLLDDRLSRLNIMGWIWMAARSLCWLASYISQPTQRWQTQRKWDAWSGVLRGGFRSGPLLSGTGTQNSRHLMKSSWYSSRWYLIIRTLRGLAARDCFLSGKALPLSLTMLWTFRLLQLIVSGMSLLFLRHFATD